VRCIRGATRAASRARTTFYTGDCFPAWRNNLFVGGLQYGRLPHTGHMHRVVFNEKWQEVRREALFVDLRNASATLIRAPTTCSTC
jgi:glucose/arabinose dehydrogenase